MHILSFIHVVAFNMPDTSGMPFFVTIYKIYNDSDKLGLIWCEKMRYADDGGF